MPEALCINVAAGIGRRARSTEAVEFFNVLTSPQLLETTEALLPEHRERLYPPTVTLSMFMRQVLEADGSCQKAVNGWSGIFNCFGNPRIGWSGLACQARARKPVAGKVLRLVRFVLLAVNGSRVDIQQHEPREQGLAADVAMVQLPAGRAL